MEIAILLFITAGPFLLTNISLPLVEESYGVLRLELVLDIGGFWDLLFPTATCLDAALIVSPELNG